MPNLIGGIVLGYIWNLMLNGILANFGVSLTYDAKYGFWGLVEAARIDGATNTEILTKIIIPMVMPSITICMFLTVSNSFKLFDQNLALTAGAPSDKSAMLALDIYNTFYGRVGWEGVGQAKAVLFFIIVAVLSLPQLITTRSKEVES